MNQKSIVFEAPKLTPNTELAAVWEVMQDGRWRSLAEIATALQLIGRCHLTTSISARLRELSSRGFTKQSRVRTGTTWEYRVTL